MRWQQHTNCVFVCRHQRAFNHGAGIFRPQYAALLAGKPWDIVTIMLGTNDAKDSGDGGPNNWHHNCGGKWEKGTPVHLPEEAEMQ